MDKGAVFEKLIHIARNKGIQVKFVPFCASYGRITKDRIGIANDIDIDKINYTLAHEQAHAYLHYEKGDILQDTELYEEQADRAAVMLLEAIQTN